MEVNNNVNLNSVEGVSNIEESEKAQNPELVENASSNPEVLEKTDENSLAGFEIAEADGNNLLTASLIGDFADKYDEIKAKMPYTPPIMAAGAALGELIRDKLS